MFIESFWLRVALLIAVLSIVAIIDFYLKGYKSKKWKEYLFVFSMGILFSIFGAIHDQVTVTISPAYYAIGKGVGYDSLRLQASLVGLKSGMYAGLIFGCLFLFLNKNWNSTILCHWLKCTAISALISLVIGSSVGYISSILGITILPAGKENLRFLVVWGWHIGLYSGAVFGLLFVAFKPIYLSKFST